jgi:hypothetical protein
MRTTVCEVPHYTLLVSIVLLLLFYIQLFSSIHYSLISLIYFLPLVYAIEMPGMLFTINTELRNDNCKYSTRSNKRFAEFGCHVQYLACTWDLECHGFVPETIVSIDVTVCSLVDLYQHFRGIHCLNSESTLMMDVESCFEMIVRIHIYKITWN